jgi:predicted SAM-dependent methyltransferase
MSTVEIYLNVGCGGNHIPGFINTDTEMDIRQPLPYGDGTVTAIHAEHVAEHVTVHEAYNFMVEARRVLRPGGVLRISVPSVAQIAYANNLRYLEFIRAHGWGDGSRESAVRSIILTRQKKSWVDSGSGSLPSE